MGLILLRYGELFLKSEPVRKRFQQKLVHNIRTALNQANLKFKLKVTRERIYVETEQVNETCEILQKVFGIVSLSPCQQLNTSELSAIVEFCKQHYAEWIKPEQSFAVRATRINKHPYTSRELAAAVGNVIERKVDLNNPDVELFVEVRKNETFVYTKKLEGAKGLPVGVSGKVVCLISGGIDSAAAAWLMLKRGCTLIALHANLIPYSDERALERVKAVLRVLSNWSAGEELRAYAYNHGPNLEQIIKHAPRNLTCVLCKRMMYRVACCLAKQFNAKAIVTGESLAQVASQTLDNLAVIDQASELPVFRPLIGSDKEEGVRLARQIGSYEASCMPALACTAVPRKPKTKAELDKVLEAEAKLELNSLLQKSLKNLHRLSFELT